MDYICSMEFNHDVEKSLEVLDQGGLILYPTDTVWGIGCDATNAEAVKKIYELKQRAASKSMIVLLADERDILQYVAGIDLAVFDYLDNASKPTTVIYNGAIGLADNLVNEDGSIAIRIVKEDFCRHLIKRFRKPVVSTSANLSGEPTPRNFAEIPEHIQKAVDYVVEYRQNDHSIAAPSAVVRWENGEVNVIRP
ncbi:L-threonylcarbamoyladenylate synthase [Pseudobacter ginsenosidimutans]|uniref:L-threonylcarbamoyladenylate synthase n=1 Tax=Pseudobacter ginsenosidimutans TaxID=661488 RepID=A0A4Q7MZF6_9BACT|nr:L-threonylcarbamoyladenylate synthase [Pseudobacter ginsenosidimutans]RZS74343.1 L-threonylcarbamoyladenylate synthase [Pseudobacter ginsenosidimutans]